MGIIYPPHWDRVKPFSILGETILKSFLAIFSFFLVSFKILQNMWTGGFYFMFSFCPSKFWQKSVDQWTSNNNSEKIASCIFMYILKCGTCGQKVPFYFMFSFCYVPFTILTQKVWTGGQVMKIILISLFLFTLYPSNFWQKHVDRWTSNENV